jgi:hypothetical protein
VDPTGERSLCQREIEVNLSHIKHRFIGMNGKGSSEKAGVRDMKKGGGELSYYIERRDCYARI